MKLLYIAQINNGPVIQSQVIELLNHYYKTSSFEKIIFLAGLNFYKPSISGVIDTINKNIEVRFFKCFPNYPFIGELTIRSLKNTINKIKHKKDYVIHVRGTLQSYYVYKAIKSLGGDTKKIIVDVRGAAYEETAEYSDKNLSIKKLKLFHKKKALQTINNIDTFSTVSDSLKNHLIKTTKVKDIKIKVNSCLATEGFVFDRDQREYIRSKLQLNKEDILIVLSSGGNAKWQNTENTIKQLCDNFKILNLSKLYISHPNVINKFVSYSEVPKYLCAADVAVIWREPNVTNKVASPVKFSEYVACGLPIISNNSIDLITTYLRNNNCGRIINELTEINIALLIDLKNLDRESLSKKGQASYGINIIAKNYFKLYQDVAAASVGTSHISLH